MSAIREDKASYTDLDGNTLSLEAVESFLELARALGDFSKVFKTCYLD